MSSPDGMAARRNEIIEHEGCRRQPSPSHLEMGRLSRSGGNEVALCIDTVADVRAGWKKSWPGLKKTIFKSLEIVTWPVRSCTPRDFLTLTTRPESARKMFNYRIIRVIRS